MKHWLLIWRDDRGIFERLCPEHGCGHPDRLQCLDCGTFLDGPVWIADYRKNEYQARYAEREIASCGE